MKNLYEDYTSTTLERPNNNPRSQENIEDIPQSADIQALKEQLLESESQSINETRSKIEQMFQSNDPYDESQQSKSPQEKSLTTTEKMKVILKILGEDENDQLVHPLGVNGMITDTHDARHLEVAAFCKPIEINGQMVTGVNGVDVPELHWDLKDSKVQYDGHYDEARVAFHQLMIHPKKPLYWMRAANYVGWFYTKRINGFGVLWKHIKSYKDPNEVSLPHKESTSNTQGETNKAP